MFDLELKALIDSMNSDELKEVRGYINTKLNLSDVPETRVSKRFDFRICDKVKFYARGRNFEGEIIKRNPVRAKIKTSMGIWNVPYNMLTKVK